MRVPVRKAAASAQYDPRTSTSLNPGFAFWAPVSRFRVSDFGFRVPGFGFRVLRFGLPFPGLESGFRVSGVRSGVYSWGFQGFGVWDLGFRVRD